MTANDSPSTATPEERARELARSLENHVGTNDVAESADDDGAAVTCYVFRDHAEEIETLVTRSGFEVVHSHAVGDERHYVFGYSVD